MSTTLLLSARYGLDRYGVPENYEGDLSLIAPKPGPPVIWPENYEGRLDLIVPPSGRLGMSVTRLRSLVYRDDGDNSQRFYEASTDLFCPAGL